MRGFLHVLLGLTLLTMVAASIPLVEETAPPVKAAAPDRPVLPAPAPVNAAVSASAPAPVAAATPAAATEPPVAPPDWHHLVRERLRALGAPMRGESLETLIRAVDRSARRFELDPLTLIAVIQVESRFDPNAVSPRGAMGLMQLRLETARELAANLGLAWTSDDLLFEPELNILLGSYYLRTLIERFGDFDSAFAAFNVGPGRFEMMKEQGRSAPFSYAERVWEAVVALRSRSLA